MVNMRVIKAKNAIMTLVIIAFLIMEWYNQSSKSKYEGEILWSKLQNVNL